MSLRWKEKYQTPEGGLMSREEWEELGCGLGCRLLAGGPGLSLNLYVPQASALK